MLPKTKTKGCRNTERDRYARDYMAERTFGTSGVRLEPPYCGRDNDTLENDTTRVRTRRPHLRYRVCASAVGLFGGLRDHVRSVLKRLDQVI